MGGHRYDAGAWLLCATALAIAVYHVGLTQMGAFDQNIAIDTAWRMFIGQRPYTDFYIPLSPEFYVAAGWAYRWWGVAWSSLVLLSVVFGTVTFALQTIALRHFMPRLAAILVAMSCQMLAMVPISYWWYNSNASIAACVLFSTSFAMAIRPRSKALVLLFTVVLTIVSLTKVNIAALSVIATLPALVTLRPLRIRVIAGAAVSAMLTLGFLVLNHLNPVDVVKAYLHMAGVRGTPSVQHLLFRKPNEAYITLPLIVACVAADVVVLRLLFNRPASARPPEFRPIVFMTTACLSVGALATMMSNEHNLVSGVPFFVVGVSSLIAWARQKRLLDDEVPRGLTSALLLAAIAALAGLVLYTRLPFATLIHLVVFRWPNDGLLVIWCVAMALSGLLLAGRLRHGRLISSTAAVMAAAVLFFLGDRALATRTVHVISLYVLLIGCCSALTALALAPLALVERWLPSRVPFGAPLAAWATPLMIIAATAGAAGTYVGAARLHMRGQGAGLFYTREPLVFSDVPLFRGYAISPTLKKIIEDIDAILTRYGAHGFTSNVFFGRRLEFGYAAFGIAPPTHLPVWWDPEAAYPPSDNPDISRHFVAHRFSLCVLHGSETDYLPDGVVQDLAANYRRIPYGDLTVFVRTR